MDEQRLGRLFAGGLTLHAVVDPLVSYYMTQVARIGRETNPLLTGALREGLGMYLAVHILLVFFSILCFYALLSIIRRADPPTDKRLARMLEVGFGGIILWGGALLTWNLLVLLRIA